MDEPNSALRATLNGREWSSDAITRGRHFCNRSLSPDVVRLIKRRHCQLARASDDADFGHLFTRRAVVNRSQWLSPRKQRTHKRSRAVKRRRPEASEHEAVATPRSGTPRLGGMARRRRANLTIHAHAPVPGEHQDAPR